MLSSEKQEHQGSLPAVDSLTPACSQILHVVRNDRKTCHSEEAIMADGESIC